VALLGLLWLGCVSPLVGVDEISERPIAFVHWSGKSGEKRAELFTSAREAAGQGGGPAAGMPEDLRARAFLSPDGSLRVMESASRHPGRLMLYWPGRDEVERVEAAPVNARPLAWSQDGERLLFVSSHRGDREQLFEYHLEKKDLRVLTSGPAAHERGDYGPEGALVLHRTDRRAWGDARETIQLASRTGRLERELVRGVPVGVLRFSPAGDVIAFETLRSRPRRDGPTFFEAFVSGLALAEGETAQALVKGREPTFTPDGAWIVFASESTAGYRLRRMRPDGTVRVPIGPGGTEERMPAVSPDGQHIAFIQEASGRRRLAVRRFDGSAERVLVSEGWSESPVW